MSLIRRPEWPAFNTNTLLSDFFDNRFFDSDLMRNQSLPAVNVRETDKSFEVELAAPGLKKSDFKITAENGILNISSETHEEKEQKENGYSRKEFSYSSFSRSFTLPDNTNQEEVKAKYEDGILKLSLGKKLIVHPKPAKAIEVR